MSEAPVTYLIGTDVAFLLYLRYCGVDVGAALRIFLKGFLWAAVVAAGVWALGMFVVSLAPMATTKSLPSFNALVVLFNPIAIAFLSVRIARDAVTPTVTPVELAALTVVAPVIAERTSILPLLNPFVGFLPLSPTVRTILFWAIALWPTWLVLLMRMRGRDSDFLRLLLMLWVQVFYILLLVAPALTLALSIDAGISMGIASTLVSSLAAVQIAINAVSMLTLWRERSTAHHGYKDGTEYLAAKFDLYRSTPFAIVCAVLGTFLLVEFLERTSLSREMIAAILLLTPLVIGGVFQRITDQIDSITDDAEAHTSGGAFDALPTSVERDAKNSNSPASITSLATTIETNRKPVNGSKRRWNRKMWYAYTVASIVVAASVTTAILATDDAESSIKDDDESIPRSSDYRRSVGRFVIGRFESDVGPRTGKALFYESPDQKGKLVRVQVCSDLMRAEWISYRVLEEGTIECRWRKWTSNPAFAPDVYGACSPQKRHCAPFVAPSATRKRQIGVARSNKFKKTDICSATSVAGGKIICGNLSQLLPTSSYAAWPTPTQWLVFSPTVKVRQINKHRLVCVRAKAKGAITPGNVDQYDGLAFVLLAGPEGGLSDVRTVFEEAASCDRIVVGAEGGIYYLPVSELASRQHQGFLALFTPEESIGMDL